MVLNSTSAALNKAWIIKHQPRTAEEIVGQDAAVQKVAQYLDGWKSADGAGKGVSRVSRRTKPLLLSGPTGCGKTIIAAVLAHERGLELVEVNASDVRNKAAITERVGAALGQMSLFGTGKLILVDEVDGLSGTKDRGGLSTLVKLFSGAAHPIICTTSDASTDKMKPLRKACTVVALEPIAHEAVVARLSAIRSLESVGMADEKVSAVARRSGGDLRAAINDLQTVASTNDHDLDVLGDRDQTATITDALLRVLKTTSAEVALSAFDNVPEDLNAIFSWLDENLPQEYTKPQDLARAYAALSTADVFFGRIRRWQYYRFYVYVYALLSVGVATAKDERYKGMPNFKRSDRGLKIWIAKNANLKRTSIAEKVAEATHTSVRRALHDTMPFLMRAARAPKFRELIGESFDLDDDEVAWLARKAA